MIIPWKSFKEATPANDAVFFYTLCPLHSHHYTATATIYRIHDQYLQVKRLKDEAWTTIGPYGTYIPDEDKGKHFWVPFDDLPFKAAPTLKHTWTRCPLCNGEQSVRPVISNLAGEAIPRRDPLTGNLVYVKRCSVCGATFSLDARAVERRGIL